MDAAKPYFLRVMMLTAWAWSGMAMAQSCFQFPKNSESPVVKICESGDQYLFRVDDRFLEISKSEFQQRVTQALSGWLERHHHPAGFDQALRFEVWMSIPEVNPAAAQPRIVVSNGSKSVTFWVDLWSDDWQFKDQETAILGASHYPDSFGYRPCVILAQSHPNMDPQKVIEALVRSGATTVRDDGGGWFKATTGAFEEAEVAAVARKSYGDVIKLAQVNSVMEWIAQRGMAFSFSTIDFPTMDFSTIDLQEIADRD
jgi:hypothetical protein